MTSPDDKRFCRLALVAFCFSVSSFIIGPLGFIPGILLGRASTRRLHRQPELEDYGLSRFAAIVGLVFLAIYVITTIVIAFILLISFSRHSTADPRFTASQSELHMISQLLEHYREKFDEYPSTQQGVAALVRRPEVDAPENWRGYMVDENLIDSWGNPYRYRCPGIRNPNTYDLWSIGADGLNGSEDDLVEW